MAMKRLPRPGHHKRHKTFQGTLNPEIPVFIFRGVVRHFKLISLGSSVTLSVFPLEGFTIECDSELVHIGFIQKIINCLPFTDSYRTLRWVARRMKFSLQMDPRTGAFKDRCVFVDLSACGGGVHCAKYDKFPFQGQLKLLNMIEARYVVDGRGNRGHMQYVIPYKARLGLNLLFYGDGRIWRSEVSSVRTIVWPKGGTAFMNFLDELEYLLIMSGLDAVVDCVPDAVDALAATSCRVSDEIFLENDRNLYNLNSLKNAFMIFGPLDSLEFLVPQIFKLIRVGINRNSFPVGQSEEINHKYEIKTRENEGLVSENLGDWSSVVEGEKNNVEIKVLTTGELMKLLKNKSEDKNFRMELNKNWLGTMHMNWDERSFLGSSVCVLFVKMDYVLKLLKLAVRAQRGDELKGDQHELEPYFDLGTWVDNRKKENWVKGPWEKYNMSVLSNRLMLFNVCGVSTFSDETKDYRILIKIIRFCDAVGVSIVLRVLYSDWTITDCVQEFDVIDPSRCIRLDHF